MQATEESRARSGKALIANLVDHCGRLPAAGLCEALTGRTIWCSMTTAQGGAPVHEVALTNLGTEFLRPASQ